MSNPDEWTDADPATLPVSWGDDTDDPGPCARCGRSRDREFGDYCEACHETIQRRRVRR